MVNHSTLCRSIQYDYMNILTWTILKKTQILNGCETFAFKYICKYDHFRFFQSICEADGAKLVEIGSELEQLHLSSILAQG